MLSDFMYYAEKTVEIIMLGVWFAILAALIFLMKVSVRFRWWVFRMIGL